MAIRASSAVLQSLAKRPCERGPSWARGVTAKMPRKLKLVPGTRMRSEEEARKLSAAELRAMLSAAEAREAEQLRAEKDRLRAERPPVAIVPDLMLGVPPALLFTARSLPPVMTVSEAASILRVSEPTIRLWIKSGRLTAGQTQRRGRLMIPRDAVLAVLAAPRSV